MNPTASRQRGAPRARTAPLHADDGPATVAASTAEGLCEWRTAVVLDVQGPALTLRLDGRPRAARVAFGCLMVVRAADTVAVLAQAGQCWVMAVLERPGCQDVALHAGAALELHADRIQVKARQSLNLEAPQAAVSCEQAQFMGRGLRVVASSIKAIGAVLDTVFDTVRHYSKQHQRTTDGVDRTRAQHLELHAGQLMQLHAAHALIDGERLVKARGAQIHLG